MGEPTWKVEVLLAGSWRGASSALLSNGHHHIVVDTGMPHEAHLLVGALRERGFRPQDIGIIINTHFHVDHALNNSLFPHSLIYAPQESYDWCASLYSDLRDDQNWEKLVLRYYPEAWDHERAQTHMQKLRRFALRWWDVKRVGSPRQFRWLETDQLPEGLQCMLTSGHVPGHASILVESGAERVVIAGDALLSRDHEGEVLTMPPVNRRQFELDRARLLDLRGRLVPGHGPEFALSHPPSNLPPTP